jgi:hypothetical protein
LGGGLPVGAQGACSSAWLIPSIIARRPPAGHCSCRPSPANPACGPGDADHQQHTWSARQGTPSPSPHRWLSGWAEGKCGAIGPAGKMVSHPERGATGTSYTAVNCSRRCACDPLEPNLGLKISTPRRPCVRPTAGFSPSSRIRPLNPRFCSGLRPVRF